ncbi:MAG: hypothetical protein Q7J06_07825, partial [Bacteroidales bacterium]|nr:hypothetical protein [Bacteroidales bacterium]
IQLSLYKQLIQAKFHKNIPLVSGGTSVTIPLLLKGLLPGGVNHFRVGETLFFGNDLYNNTKLENMESNVMRMFAEIIELSEKPVLPEGDMGLNLSGNSVEINKEDYNKSSYRAILDFGLLDIEEKNLQPIDKEMVFVGSSSDMIVFDIGENLQNYKIGDLIEFEINYLGLLSLLNSNYIEKRVV